MLEENDESINWLTIPSFLQGKNMERYPIQMEVLDYMELSGY